MNRIGKSFTAAVMLAGVTACASSPEEISAAHVSPLQYQPYNCQQLAMESARVSSRSQDLYNRVKKLADDDAMQTGVGLILFWPALFFLEGGDGPEAAEYARLKGESTAIEQAAIGKNCVGNFKGWEPPPPPKDAEAS